jgi:ribonuclease/clavin/mitogillin
MQRPETTPVACLPLRTPTLAPATHTNCYRVGDVLVDPGSPWVEEQERLAAWVREGPPVRRVVLTHHHHDHVGGVTDIVRRTGARVCAHVDARLPFPVDERLRDGDVLPTGAAPLACLHTPGHADGHLALVVGDEGDVIVGDLLAGVGTIVLAPPEGHLRTFLASLARVAEVASRAHPAHGPCLMDARAAIAAVTAHRHARSAQVEAALAAGARTPAEIAAVVYAGVPGVDLALAAAQAHAHLVWLEEEGRARRVGEGWGVARAVAPVDAALRDAGESLLAQILGARTPALRVLEGGRAREDASGDD